MELIQTIRAEIERLVDEYKPIVGGVDELTGAHIILAKLFSFLDTLQEPENPIYELNQFLINWVRDGQTDTEKDARWEAYRRFYELHDEAMMQEPGKPIDPKDAMKELDEKIALVKQRETWDGVDVDKYMDEVRGREPKFNLDKLREVAVPLSDEEKEAHRKMMDERRKKYEEMGILQEPKSMRKRLAEWSKTPEGREAYEKVAEEMRRIAEDTDLAEEITAFVESHYHIRNDETLENGSEPLTTSDLEDIARHFFDLGLNARKV